MANLFSGFLGTGTDGSRTDQFRADAGEGGGKMRAAVIPLNVATGSITNADTIRVASFKTNARILRLTAYIDALGTSGSIDVGFFKSDVYNDGAVVEVDTFADAYDVSSAVSADIFETTAGGGGSVTLDGTDRGKEIWELVGQTEDPGEQWDLVITVNNKGANNLTGTFFIEYTDAD